MTEQAEVIDDGGQKHHELSDKDYSKAVQKRIGKEVAKRKSAEDSFRIAKEEAAGWRKKAEEAEERFDNADDDRLKQAKEANRENLKKALEDGNTDKQAEYTEEFSNINTERAENTRRAEERERRKKEVPPTPKEEEVQQHPSAAAFLERSKDWIATNGKARERAIEIESDLRKNEGFEWGDDLYEELEARLFDEMPDLGPKGAGDDDDLVDIEIDDEVPERKTEKPTVTPSSRGQGRHPRRRESGDHMSASAKATMVRYDLDPDKASDIKAYLKHHKGVL